MDGWKRRVELRVVGYMHASFGMDGQMDGDG